MNDLISVIVPVYNVEKYIKRCIKSITEQTYKNLEIIVVDDGSPDNCPQICDELANSDSRIKIIHTKNNGVSIARKIGIENANGKYIMFVDSDDWMEIETIEKLHKLINTGDYQIARCLYKVVNNESEAFVECENETINEYEFDGMIKNIGTLSLWALFGNLYKKELFDKVENLSFDLTVGEDLVLNYFIFKNCKKMIVTNQKYYYYFRHEGAVSYQKLKPQFIENTLKAYTMIESDFDKNDTAYPIFIAIILQKDFELLMQIVKQNSCNEYYKIISKQILNYKKYAFKSSSNGILNFKHKIGIVLLMLCPPVFKKFLKLK